MPSDPRTVSDDSQRLLTIEDVAALLHLTPAAIHKYRYRGEGPRGYRVGKRILFAVADVTAWLESRREEPEP
jgi:predicted DNA-binding transcriptional regulator AlpA